MPLNLEDQGELLLLGGVAGLLDALLLSSIFRHFCREIGIHAKVMKCITVMPIKVSKDIAKVPQTRR
jgi:hypothetical protein